MPATTYFIPAGMYEIETLSQKTRYHVLQSMQKVVIVGQSSGKYLVSPIGEHGIQQHLWLLVDGKLLNQAIDK